MDLRLNILSPLIWILAAVVSVNGALAAENDTRVDVVADGCVVNVQLENDLFGSGADSHYTHGSRLSVVVPKPVKGEKFTCHPFEADVEETGVALSSTLDRLLMDNPRKRRVSFVLGQNIFTPEDIRATKLISDDRPYAGWLYLGLGLVTERKTKKNVEAVDNFEIDIGMV